MPILIYVKEGQPISVFYLPLHSKTKIESCCLEHSAEMKRNEKVCYGGDRVSR